MVTYWVTGLNTMINTNTGTGINKQIGLCLIMWMIPMVLSAQMLANGDFSNGTNKWVFYAQGGASATGSVSEGEFKVQISNPGTEGWQIQLSQSGISIQEDSTYRVRFEARADSARTINAAVGLNHEPWDWYAGKEVALRDTMQVFEFEFKMQRSTEVDSRIVFEFGKSTHTVYLDNISIEKVITPPPKGMKPTPFSRGVNLTGWFQAASPEQIDFTKFTKQDFLNIKSLGADVIRLPINLHAMVGPGPEFQPDPLFLFFLDEVVNWAEELDVYLILDNHTFNPSVDTHPAIGDTLVPIWKNMARHFNQRSEYILYEVLNEPHGIADDTWNAIQQQVIDAIREVDSLHTIIVGGAEFNSYNNLKYMPEYADTNLIYTYHFYDPFLLTHQGASWVSPSLVPLAGVPFPASSAPLPTTPSELKGTWVESALEEYPTVGTEEHVRKLLDIAIDFAQQRGVAIFCGELGVYNRNSDNQSRVNWHQVVNTYLTEHGVAWTIWDYKGSFGIFEKESNELFEHDLNQPLVQALGFTLPPQTDFQLLPDSTAFTIYDDYTAQGIAASGGNSGTLSFYHNDEAYNGEFSIYWTGANQYTAITFDFTPVKDLTYLADEGYSLSLWVKGDTPGSSFDLRFVDTDTGSDDHPWRVNLRVDEEIVSFDGTWHDVSIPLHLFPEMGAWEEDTWYPPEGKFDWSRVSQFQIVAEEAPLGEARFWFDDIRIDGALIHSIEEEDIPHSITLYQNYPNPFNPRTVISYRLGENTTVSLKVYNAAGRLVSTLVNSRQQAGYYSVPFNATGLASGVYFYELRSDNLVQRKSMVLIK